MIFLFLLIINLVNGFIFYYNTTTTSLKQINNSTSNNKDIFVFFPGTSSKCNYYSDLFDTIGNSKNKYLENNSNKTIDILCIDYKTSLNYSIKYYNHNSFQNRASSLKYSIIESLKKIKLITNKSFISNKDIPVWDKIISSGHSQGGVIATAFAKKYHLKKLILFSSPGCQFNKTLHNWLSLPFATKINRIYGIMSLQDTILPWNYGNPDFGCHKKDGIKDYLQSLHIENNSIRVIKNNSNTTIFNKSHFFLLNMPFLNGTISHLITCFNTNILNNIMMKLWKRIIHL